MGNNKKTIFNKSIISDNYSVNNGVIKTASKNFDDTSFDDSMGNSHFFKDEDTHNYQAHTMSLQRSIFEF